mgnify:FL=1
MKTFCFTVLWAVAVCQTCLSQSAFPFPTAHAEWVVYKVYPIIGPTDEFLVYRNFVEGDSVFMGKTYTKVFRQDLCRCICSVRNNYLPIGAQPMLLGGVREENHRVYFTKFGAGNGQSYYSPVTDTLLFDFTAQAGDSIPYAGNTTLVVDLVDTASDGRKQIHFKVHPPGYPGVWKEGIGSAGILETTEFFFSNGSCFSDQVPSACSIPCAVTAVEDPVVHPRFQVMPTLASDVVRIDGSDPSEQYSVQILSSTGALLETYSGILSGDPINIGHLPSGILVFQIRSSNGAVGAGKVIKGE